jgi:RNA polymerase sigma factor (sigma-70 family)
MQVPREPPDDRTTLEILGRIRDGDQQGWERLYRRYHDELLFAVRRKLGPRLRGVLESEDVLQSVALEAFKALPRFQHRGEGSLRAFLHTLVLNKIRDRADAFGAQKRDGAVPLTDSLAARVEASASSAPEYFDQGYGRLEQAIARLPEESRTVLLLRRIDGLSSKEVAERLGKSDVAVRKIYSRALAQLALAAREDSAVEPSP